MTPESGDRAPGRSEGTDGSGPPAANPYARTYRHAPFTVVEAAGEIDMATAGFLAEHLHAATEGERPDVLVDLRPVDFFDCSGLRVLCRADSRAREHGGRLRIVSRSARIRQLLRASGLLGRFPPLPDLPEQQG
ncbi:STAS domain-containing protein [Streptomyces sp. S3(2020)]|uniref:STAS domain-containing protein n=1 Tax=Streptomyces sp. S3(2020) TaxID=2732044 RepID=UPI001487EDAC|nr:STAS domain-containing protein [Streptomyces sp. S3(2020)]NNN30157.1 STAS domain-containing protein [Streptomyces sp. S3(2020)]